MARVPLLYGAAGLCQQLPEPTLLGLRIHLSHWLDALVPALALDNGIELQLEAAQQELEAAQQTIAAAQQTIANREEALQAAEKNAEAAQTGQQQMAEALREALRVKFTFATSRFKLLYGPTGPAGSGKAGLPHQYELFNATHQLVLEYAQRHGCESASADSYFGRVQQNAVIAGGTSELLAQIKYVAVRLWTTAETMVVPGGHGVELCTMINDALRNEQLRSVTVEHAVVFARALNAFCVTRGSGGPLQWPEPTAAGEICTYRGGGLPREHKAFYTVGKQFRVPMFLATSASPGIANRFMERARVEDKVLWKFKFDETLAPAERCKHINFIDRTDQTVDGENEYLFAPFSAFKVLSVEWSAQPTVASPHRVCLAVAPDNRGPPSMPDGPPEDLPLAAWS